MNRELATKVADAVLYEGYMLYPYRPSALKNRQRWSFGIVYPPAYEEVRLGTERSGMHSEVLVRAASTATVNVQLRFLQLRRRQLFAVDGGQRTAVESLEVYGSMLESCDDGIERLVDLAIEADDRRSLQESFIFSDKPESESVYDYTSEDEHVVAEIEHKQEQVAGTVTISSARIRTDVFKVTIDVANFTTMYEGATRDEALFRSLLSAHLILTVSGGEFVSLLDPPEELRGAAQACKNIGNFPVLVGSEGERDMMLCSPIVLYDYPQIAPESAGDFYDATEMDEMLTLRVMTMTDDEKHEIRHADARVRSLLERTEQNAREQLQRTHGAIRSLRPVSENHE